MRSGEGRTETGANPGEVVMSFATPADYAVCRRLHRQYGTTYYFASKRFPRDVQRRTHAVYGFVRVPDEWVDNPGAMSPDERLAKLDDYKSQLIRGLDGVRPEHPVLRAFVDVMHESAMPLDEPLLFLDAMAMDVSVDRYETYADLKEYMRGSASAVGVMMCSVMGAPLRPDVLEAAKALGEAMQLTNFLRDVGEDGRRGRLYLPLEDLRSWNVTEEEVFAGEVTDRFVQLMKFEMDRARMLYARADEGIPQLPPHVRFPVRLARVLYARILDKIEERGYDVFSGRARTSLAEKLRTAGQLLIRRQT